jgi:CcmD family protein
VGIKRIVGRIVLAAVLIGSAATAPEAAAQQRPDAAQEEFVPIDELPPEEKLPAAPFLIAAYSAAWLIVAVYLWSIWRRLQRVERELADVARRAAPDGVARHGGSGRP